MFYCEIISGLWIGDIDIMLHKKFIKENNINIIINCTQQIAFPEVDVKKVRIPFSDRLENDIDFAVGTTDTSHALFVDAGLNTININSPMYVNNNLIKKVFNDAIKKFLTSRNIEGKKIKEVLLKKLKQIKSANTKIKKQNINNLKKRSKLYKAKALDLMENLDEGRLEQEVAILALKHDVNEEIDRIFFHLESLQKELNKNLCSGKKIDFILQELFREANTLSVKLDDPNLKNNAIDMKLFIEEMREQTQNVE